MTKKSVNCVICGKEHKGDSEEVLKIHHPTAPMTAAYACKAHKGVEKEHARCYPANARKKSVKNETE